MVEFAVLYSFSAALAVWTRSTVACVVGSLLLWGLCSAVNFHRLAAVLQTENGPAAASPVADALLRGGLLGVAQTGGPGAHLAGGAAAPTNTSAPCRRCGRWSPNRSNLALSVLTSLLFAAALLAAACLRLAKMDY